MKKSNKKSFLMKEFIMLAAVLTASVHTAKAENIQFQDENVKNICVYYWDTDLDGELSFEEALQVKKLGSAFENRPITCFDELQYFNGLEEIDEWAFAECADLQSITLPADIKSIGLCAFYGCTSLQEINIPAAVETIDKASFKYCVSLKSVKLPASVKTLGNNAFQYCTKISSFNMGQVEKIGARALAGCTALKYLYMPNTLTSVGEYAFEKSGIINLSLSPNLEGITPYMLAEMTSLTTINLQYDCRFIGEHAFEGCTALRSVNITPYITSIGSKAFNRCPALNWVYVETVTPPTLATDAFMTNSEGKYIPILNVLEEYLDLYQHTSVWNNFSKYKGQFIINMGKQYASFSANYDVDFSQNDDLKVYTVAGCTENKKVVLEELKDKYVPAYTGENNDNFHGVLLFGEAGKDYTCKLGKKGHNDPETEIFSKENLLIGCTNETYIEPETENALNYILCDNTFKAFTNAGFIRDGKAYLSLPKKIAAEVGLAKEEPLYLDCETTDIFVVHENVNGEDKFYTIDGMETDMPKGIYIHSGKKYLPHAE